MKAKNERDALAKALAKINTDAAKNVDVIISQIESRKKERSRMRDRINKEFESVSGKPKRNLPV